MRPSITSDSRRSREPQFPTIGTSKRIYRQTKIHRHGQNRRSMTVRHTDTVAQTERSEYRDGEISGTKPHKKSEKNRPAFRSYRPFRILFPGSYIITSGIIGTLPSNVSTETVLSEHAVSSGMTEIETAPTERTATARRRRHRLDRPRRPLLLSGSVKIRWKESSAY